MSENKLTRVQTRVLNSLEEYPVYVFKTSTGGYSFGESKENTCSRVYITATSKSLIKKGICAVKLTEVEGSLDNCVGILVRREV